MKEEYREFQRVKKLKVSKERRILKINSNGNINLAIDEGGQLLSWGINRYGCLGHQKSSDIYHPTIVNNLTPFKVHDAACAQNYFILIILHNNNHNNNLDHYNSSIFHLVKTNIAKTKTIINSHKNNTIHIINSNSQFLHSSLNNKSFFNQPL